MTLEARNAIAPQMRDYDRVGEMWVPYLMFFNSPSVQLPSVSTDVHGFRTTHNSRGGVLDLRTFQSSDMRRSVVLGSSSAFGVGASSDACTVASRLNAQSDCLWFNYGGRAFNSTQELLLLSLFRPERIDSLVIFSGVNNLTLAYLSPKTSRIYNSFFRQRVYERAMANPPDASIGVRRAARSLLVELANKVRPSQSPPRASVENNYEDIMEAFRRDLQVLKLLAPAKRLLFVLQPLATWIDKVLAPEEVKLFSILDSMSGDWRILADFLRVHRQQYARDVESICSGLEVNFIDLNEDPAFRQSEWLFVDRIHLTDRGYQLVADRILGGIGRV